MMIAGLHKLSKTWISMSDGLNAAHMQGCSYSSKYIYKEANDESQI